MTNILKHFNLFDALSVQAPLIRAFVYFDQHYLETIRFLDHLCMCEYVHLHFHVVVSDALNKHVTVHI